MLAGNDDADGSISSSNLGDGIIVVVVRIVIDGSASGVVVVVLVVVVVVVVFVQIIVRTNGVDDGNVVGLAIGKNVYGNTAVV